MDNNKKLNRFLQFELWKACNHGCKFCYNLGQKDFTDVKTNIKIINDKIKDFDSQKYSQLGIIGGEFFDKQLEQFDVKYEFYSLVDTVIEKIKSNEIERFLVTTSLMYKDLSDILEFLNKFDEEKIINKLLICTSWDSKFRFKDNEEEIWKNNIKVLKNRYSELKIHTEIIITDDFVTKCLADKFNIDEFEKENSTYIDFIQPTVPYALDITKVEFENSLPGFFPKRSNFLKLVGKWISEGYDLRDLLDIKNHSDDCYTLHLGKLQAIENRSDVEHYISPLRRADQVGYIDSEKFMRKDVELLIEEY